MRKSILRWSNLWQNCRLPGRSNCHSMPCRRCCRLGRRRRLGQDGLRQLCRSWLDCSCNCSGPHPAVRPRRGLALASLRRGTIVPAWPGGEVCHLRLRNEPPHCLVRRLPVRPLLEHLRGQIVATGLLLGCSVCQVVAVPVLLAHAGRQGLRQRAVAGQPLDGPALRTPKRLPCPSPEVGIGALAELLAGYAAALDAGTLPLNSFAVREDDARLGTVEDLHDGCQLGPANRLLPGARPRTVPPDAVDTSDYRPRGHADLRQPRPQTAAVRVVAPAAGHLHWCIGREPLPPSRDGGELNRNAIQHRALRQGRECRRLGPTKCLQPQGVPPRAPPLAVMQVLRLAAAAEPRSVFLPLHGRELRDRIACHHADEGGQTVGREVHPGDLAADPAPLNCLLA